MKENGVLTRKPKIIEKVDIYEDLKEPTVFPWPHKDKSISEINCRGVFEYVPGKLRGRFMDEIFRVLTDDGKASISVPYWNHAMGVQDFMYEWPMLCEQSFLYFNKAWREANKVRIRLSSDFDFTYGYSMVPEVDARSDESKQFAITHYSNSIMALHVLLTKVKK